ncbi:MAG: hypothetical protein FJZ43_01345 [Candidatus Staskawiczbacteria bacterium]|nr:hypothetical protein [Candidatus Staskawiczbacteria bacterium]
MATWIFELILQTNKKLRDRYYRRHQLFFGYHVHHSTVGLLVIVAGVFAFIYGTLSVSLGVAGFGAGIVLMHTISSRRFVFIERETFSESKGKKRK